MYTHVHTDIHMVIKQPSNPALIQTCTRTHEASSMVDDLCPLYLGPVPAQVVEEELPLRRPAGDAPRKRHHRALLPMLVRLNDRKGFLLLCV